MTTSGSYPEDDAFFYALPAPSQRTKLLQRSSMSAFYFSGIISKSLSTLSSI